MMSVQMRDMSLNEQDGKLVACSCNNSFVGVWVLDLNKLKPFSGPAVRHAPSQSKCPRVGCKCLHQHTKFRKLLEGLKPFMKP